MISIRTQAPFMTMFFHLFGMTLGFSWSLVLTLFFGFHVWLMFKAMTIIEFCEKSSRPKKGVDAYSRQSRYFSVHDLGPFGNMKAVLGEHVLLWFFPVNPPVGDGLNYITDDFRFTTDINTQNDVHGSKKAMHVSQNRGLIIAQQSYRDERIFGPHGMIAENGMIAQNAAYVDPFRLPENGMQSRVRMQA